MAGREIHVSAVVLDTGQETTFNCCRGKDFTPTYVVCIACGLVLHKSCGERRKLVVLDYCRILCPTCQGKQTSDGGKGHQDKNSEDNISEIQLLKKLVKEMEDKNNLLKYKIISLEQRLNVQKSSYANILSFGNSSNGPNKPAEIITKNVPMIYVKPKNKNPEPAHTREKLSRAFNLRS